MSKAEKAMRKKYEAQAKRKAQTLAVDIIALCEGLWPNSPKAAKIANRLLKVEGMTLERAQRRALKIKSEQNQPVGRIDFGDSQVDKAAAGISDGLALRMHGRHLAQQFIPSGRGRYELAPFELDQPRDRDGFPVGSASRKFTTAGRKLHVAADEFSHMRLIDIAAVMLQSHGVSTRGMAPRDLAAMALGWEQQGLPMAAAGNLGGGEMHVTGDFPSLLLDAVNKTLLMGYTEKPATWRQWVHQAEDAADYKDIHRVRLGEGSDLELIPEGKAFPQDKLGETRETYAVETRGKAFSFTRQMLINDDLNSMSVLAIRQGAAAERTVNRAVYAVLTGNPEMADGKALFHADHDNIVSSGGAPTVAQLNEMQRLLRLQKGINTQTLLNLEMAFLIIPANLEGTTKELLRSTANPASSGGNPGVANIWQGFGGLVIEAQLDADDINRYFGATRWQDADTLEVSFLQGERSPIVEQEFDFDTKGRKHTVHQTFGVAPVDHRGLVRNPGA